ncbi:hypothetical protein Esti_001663 [Eimeria stiedai]
MQPRDSIATAPGADTEAAAEAAAAEAATAEAATAEAATAEAATAEAATAAEGDNEATRPKVLRFSAGAFSVFDFGGGGFPFLGLMPEQVAHRSVSDVFVFSSGEEGLLLLLLLETRGLVCARRRVEAAGLGSQLCGRTAKDGCSRILLLLLLIAERS